MRHIDYSPEDIILYKDKRRAIKRKNDFKKKNRQKQIAEQQKDWYPAAFWEGKRGQIKRYSGGARKYFKAQANRTVRHYKGGISSGNGYRKIYDYKWQIS